MPYNKSKSRKSNKNDHKQLTELAMLFEFSNRKNTQVVFLKEGSSIDEKLSFRDVNYDSDRSNYNIASGIDIVRKLYKLGHGGRDTITNVCRNILSSALSTSFPLMHHVNRDLFLVQWASLFLKYSTDASLDKTKIYSSMSSSFAKDTGTSIIYGIVDIMNMYPSLFLTDLGAGNTNELHKIILKLYKTATRLVVVEEAKFREINFYDLYNKKDTYMVIGDQDELDKLYKNIKMRDSSVKISLLENSRKVANLVPSKYRAIFTAIVELGDRNFEEYSNTYPKPTRDDIQYLYTILIDWLEYEIDYYQIILDEFESKHNYFSSKYAGDELANILDESKSDFNYYTHALKSLVEEYEYVESLILKYGENSVYTPSKLFFNILTYHPDIFQEFDDIVVSGSSELFREKLSGLSVSFTNSSFKSKLRKALDMLVSSYNIYMSNAISSLNRKLDDPSASAPSVNLESVEMKKHLDPDKEDKSIPHVAKLRHHAFPSMSRPKREEVPHVVPMTDEELEQALAANRALFQEQPGPREASTFEDILVANIEREALSEGIPPPPFIPEDEPVDPYRLPQNVHQKKITQLHDIPHAELERMFAEGRSKLKKGVVTEVRSGYSDSTYKIKIPAKGMMDIGRVAKILSEEYPDRKQMDKKKLINIINDIVKNVIHAKYVPTAIELAEIETIYYNVMDTGKEIALAKDAYSEMKSDDYYDPDNLQKTVVAEFVANALQKAGLRFSTKPGHLFAIDHIAGIVMELHKNVANVPKAYSGEGFGYGGNLYTRDKIPYGGIIPYRRVSYRYN